MILILILIERCLFFNLHLLVFPMDVFPIDPWAKAQNTNIFVLLD